MKKKKQRIIHQPSKSELEDRITRLYEELEDPDPVDVTRGEVTNLEKADVDFPKVWIFLFCCFLFIVYQLRYLVLLRPIVDFCTSYWRAFLDVLSQTRQLIHL